MSKVKELMIEVDDLLEAGLAVEEIAEKLACPLDFVVEVYEEKLRIPVWVDDE
jgi:hypothetical protein